MIFCCGDTHGNHDILKLDKDRWHEQNNLTKEDYLIVLGDWGVIWENTPDSREANSFGYYNSKKFTTLIINGNHDNIPRMLSYPDVPMFGDTVKQISKSIFYLQNGHIYTIEGKTFFVMGGGLSVDKSDRIVGLSWWTEEMPTYATFQLGFDNLKKINNEVDYVLTHATHTSGVDWLYQQNLLIFHEKLHDPINKPLEIIRETIEYTKWFCGHYHIDGWDAITKTMILYHEIRKIC